jgi:hypothetical protein
MGISDTDSFPRDWLIEKGEPEIQILSSAIQVSLLSSGKHGGKLFLVQKV